VSGGYKGLLCLTAVRSRLMLYSNSIVSVGHALTIYPFSSLGIENGVDAGYVPDVTIYVKKPVVNPFDFDRSNPGQADPK